MTGLDEYTPETAQSELYRRRGKLASPDMSGGVVPADQLVQRAHEVEHELRRAAAVIRLGGIYFARWVCEYIDQRLWEVLEHDSLGEGLRQPGIEVSESHAKNLALVYRFFVVERDVAVEELYGIDLRTLQIAMPAIRAGDASIEQAIADARELTRKDMELAYKRGRNKELDAGEGPELVECPCCGRLGGPARFDPTRERAAT
jgi:hypothetical protein